MSRNPVTSSRPIFRDPPALILQVPGKWTKVVDLWISCVPPRSTAQSGSRIMRRKDGTQFIGRAQGSAAESTYQFYLQALSGHSPAAILEGPVFAELSFVSPWRSSDNKGTRALGFIPSDTKPDCDNAAKLLGDVLQRLGYVRNDSQVHWLITKWHGDQPGISLRLWRQV